MALTDALPSKIQKEFQEYNTLKNNVETALETIHTAFHIFKDTNDHPYPAEVSKLYRFLLLRWTMRNSEATLEDGKSSLLSLADNNRFDVFFEYLKLDSTLPDTELLQKSHKLACTKLGESCYESTINLGHLGIYLPESEEVDKYRRYSNEVRSYIIYALVVFFIFLFPIFHFAFTKIGPVFTWTRILSVVILVAFAGYMFQV